jgi:hypothetical protein
VGDQWTDLITIETDKERGLMDDAYGADTLRLMRLNDGLCFFGIKLPTEEPKISPTLNENDQSFVTVQGGMLILH